MKNWINSINIEYKKIEKRNTKQVTKEEQTDRFKSDI